MVKVYLEHNPFSETTRCEINAVDITKEPEFAKCWGDPEKSFLQDWVNDFFYVLHERENESEYEVEFFGLPSDYKDIENAKKDFHEKNSMIDIKLIQKDISVKSSEQRIKGLKKLFEDMRQNSPYEELKTDEIKRSFDGALSSEEEIGIVATMSSGKSTLLNAILHEDLLPARNEATTAVVAKIYNDKSKHEFRVSATDRDGNSIRDDVVATPEILDKLNSNKDVSDLKLFGNIPNIKEYGLRVVLSDTPGPNNSVDETHKSHTYKLIAQPYKPMILYIFNATQLEINDDRILLSDIAKEIKNSGIQSKDRFIFVLNKVDALDVAKGENAKKAIERLKEYLKGVGIDEPRIFPVSAQLSRLIRLNKNGKSELTEDENDFLESKGKRFAQQEDRHLHKLVHLSKESEKKLDELIRIAQENDDKLAFADICSGVPALEIAINEYVEKYAIRQKIKLSVQSFRGFIESQKIRANSMENISKNKENIDNAIQTLESIKKDMQNGSKAQAVQDRVNKFDFNKDIDAYLDGRSGELSKIISKLSGDNSQTDEFGWGWSDRSKSNKNNEMDISEARKFIQKAKNELEHFRMQFLGQVDERINEGFLKDAKAIFDEYKNYVDSLISDNSSFDEKFGDKISINSLIATDLNEGSILYEFKNVVQEEYLISASGNRNKAWYKPWTWFDDDYQEHWGTRDKDVFDAEKFCDEYLSRIQIDFDKEIDAIKKDVGDKVKSFKRFFGNKIKELERVMLDKINEQEKLFKNKEEFERTMKFEEERVKWIEGFIKKLDNVLEIQGA
jgi:Dynamin family.